MSDASGSRLGRRRDGDEAEEPNRRRRRRAARPSFELHVLPAASFALALLGFVGLAVAAGFDRPGVDWPWAPSLDLRLAFVVDGVAALYGLLATGVGAVVFAYSYRYLPHHLEHQGRPAGDATRFYLFLVLFMVSMVGLVAADDLILLFLFWDLTAIASYYLIGFDQDDDTDRYAALMALIVTGASAVFLLVGALLLHDRYGTFAIGEILAQVESDRTTTAAGALVLVAALAKSAQVPLHFWLPRAMVAPTPVSSYLHSAAMVAAGVFLVTRLHPVLATSDALLDATLLIGIVSMVVGGLIALTRDQLKHVLAYSTVGQYGYVTFLLGLGTAKAVAAASFYVVVHALAKCGLFLTAGAVTVATGENRLSQLGGLWRTMPWLALSSGIGVAALVAVPATVGFFADEVFFAAALERGPLLAVVAVAAAVLTFAYLGRFWIRLFLGPVRTREVRPLDAGLVFPVAVLALLLVGFGFVVSPVADLAARAAESVTGAPVPVDLAYHLDTRAENLMALATYVLGVTVLLTMTRWWPAAVAFARLGERLGPDRMYGRGLELLNGLSDRIHDVEVRDLRTRIATVLMPAVVLVALGIWATPTGDAYTVGAVGGEDVGLALVVMFAAGAAFATTFPRHHLTLVLVLSSVGFSLAVAYAFFGGPDVAVVAVLVETILALAFLGVFALLPRNVLRREAQVETSRSRRWRDPLIAVVSGGIAFLVIWGALSRPAPEESVAAELTRRAPEAHAADVVTAILADFRGLDTLVEISVIAVALIGVVALVGGRRA